MPENWQPFPLIAPPNESVEEEQLDQSAATMVDWIPVVVDGKLQLMKRPGLTPWITLGTNLPIDGLHWWDKQGVALVVSNGRVWKITDSAGTYSELTGSTALRQSSPATFADDGVKCVIANGANMVHTDLSTLTTMADADAPTGVTHVAAMDGYLLANDTNTGEVSFSALKDLTNWAALDFFTAESRPDDVVAMKEGFREICAVGSESVEFWYNDGSAPFARISGSAQPFGISAPQSLALVGDTWMWLGDKRRFLTMQGRQVVPVSSPYDRVIQRYQAVSDAIGYAMHVDGIPLYVLNFPTARQTLCYNPETKLWGKWGYWDTNRAEYQRYRGQTYCYAKDWNFHLVGDYTNGIIYKASRTAFTDNTNMIRSLLRTGKVSFDTNASKESHCFRLRCKRGLGDATTANPQIMMRQRVNNKAQWQNERWKSLGQVGQHEMLIDWRRNGIYHNVQREVIHSDPTDCILVGAEEDVALLGR